MYQLHSRHGEKGSVPFRSVRFYTLDSEWWFAIRRGPDQGPYPNQDSAKQALVEYLNDQFAFERQQDREPLGRRNKSV
jgi:hypothetical protein